jgi:hypothetical protein
VENNDELATLKTRSWVRPDAYFEALARRRTARRARDGKPRGQADATQFSLSTLPFLILFGALFVIAAGMMILAWPGSLPEPPRKAAQHEQGIAEKGWFQEAEKDFHKS